MAPQRLTTNRSLLVVGGGPAGVAAATTAAHRGIRVVLAEQHAQLGGQLALAGRTMAHRHLWQRWLRWAQLELAAASVDVRLNERITDSDCSGFGRVVIATGARPAPAVRIPGKFAVLGSWTAITRPAPLTGGSVLVSAQDREWSGLDAAEVLATHGYAVTLLSEDASIGSRLRHAERASYEKRLTALSVNVLPGHKLVLPPECAEPVLHDTGTGEVRPIPRNVGSIVVAAERIPNDTLWKRTHPVHPCVVRVGDALTPRSFEEAITEGSTVITGVMGQSIAQPMDSRSLFSV